MAFSKTRRPIGSPVSLPKPATQFMPLPVRTAANLVLPLSAVLPNLALPAATGSFVFHAAGDTGGVHGTDTQTAVAEAMEAQINHATPGAVPAFLYNLGDVVYYNGVSTDYPQQFYEPYQHYPAPIFAIPGNHDCDTGVRGNDPPDTEPSLYGFMQNFCSPTAQRNSPYRDTMTQPYCYWTLTVPFAHIVGLHSNVDGELDGRGTVQQQSFLQQQLAEAPADKWLILAVHHPCYSLDSAHGGYPSILAAIDKAATAAQRWPDVVLSGHVHNSQRFSRHITAPAQLPYIIAGAGGYANRPALMHKMQKDGAFDTLPFVTTEHGVSLEAFNCVDPGFLRVTTSASEISFEYFTVPFQGTPPAAPYDKLTLHPHVAKTP